MTRVYDGSEAKGGNDPPQAVFIGFASCLVRAKELVSNCFVIDPVAFFKHKRSRAKYHLPYGYSTCNEVQYLLSKIRL